MFKIKLSVYCNQMTSVALQYFLYLAFFVFLITCYVAPRVSLIIHDVKLNTQETKHNVMHLITMYT